MRTPRFMSRRVDADAGEAVVVVVMHAWGAAATEARGSAHFIYPTLAVLQRCR